MASTLGAARTRASAMGSDSHAERITTCVSGDGFGWNGMGWEALAPRGIVVGAASGQGQCSGLGDGQCQRGGEGEGELS
jgi:hypothetical protein